MQLIRTQTLIILIFGDLIWFLILSLRLEIFCKHVIFRLKIIYKKYILIYMSCKYFLNYILIGDRLKNVYNRPWVTGS